MRILPHWIIALQHRSAVQPRRPADFVSAEPFKIRFGKPGCGKRVTADQSLMPKRRDSIGVWCQLELASFLQLSTWVGI